MSSREVSVLRALTDAGMDPAALGVSPAECAAFCEVRGVSAPFIPDAVLALACSRGNAAALAEFDRRYSGEFAGALSRFRFDRTTIDELTQIVREKLFVGRPDAPPKIAGYGGRGPLVGWLRAVIVRAAIDWRRHEALEPSPSDDVEPLLEMGRATDDPELENIRARCAAPFRDALREAIRALDRDERNALRLHVSEGLSLDDIARMYGVHRATIARWIQSARDSVLSGTRKRLEARLKLSSREFDSLVNLCRSRLEFSFADDGA